MRYLNYKISLNEIPGKIACCINMTGCPLKCKGCHSPEMQDGSMGIKLTDDLFFELHKKYGSNLDVVCFMGGEWNPDLWVFLASIKQSYRYETALYTGLGLHQVPTYITQNLDYLKVGPYIEKFGGLESEHTNQSLIDMKTKTIILGKNKGLQCL